MSDFNLHNTTCADCGARINPDDSDAVSCCEFCKDYFCTACLKDTEANYGDDICESCYDEQNPVDPYRQAFEALAVYSYNLEKVNAGHYELMILDPDPNSGALFNEYSSDFFTLMQYFYKWQLGQKGVAS